MAGSESDYAGDVLAGVVGQLAVDSIGVGERALGVLRARSPEMVRRSEEYGDDPLSTSAAFMETLLGSLRSDVDLEWDECEESASAYGRRRAAQGAPLEVLIDELAVYRRATIELISVAIQDNPRRDELIAHAQGHLEDVVERLTAAIASGYVDRINAKNQAPSANRRKFARGDGTRSRTLQRSRPAALSLLAIGLDKLKKKSNDRRGRRYGGGALKRVAQALRRVVRASGAVAPLGRAISRARRRKVKSNRSDTTCSA